MFSIQLSVAGQSFKMLWKLTWNLIKINWHITDFSMQSMNILKFFISWFERTSIFALFWFVMFCEFYICMILFVIFCEIQYLHHFGLWYSVTVLVFTILVLFYENVLNRTILVCDLTWTSLFLAFYFENLQVGNAKSMKKYK